MSNLVISYSFTLEILGKPMKSKILNSDRRKANVMTQLELAVKFLLTILKKKTDTIICSKIGLRSEFIKKKWSRSENHKSARPEITKRYFFSFATRAMQLQYNITKLLLWWSGSGGEVTLLKTRNLEKQDCRVQYKCDYIENVEGEKLSQWIKIKMTNEVITKYLCLCVWECVCVCARASV